MSINASISNSILPHLQAVLNEIPPYIRQRSKPLAKLERFKDLEVHFQREDDWEIGSQVLNSSGKKYYWVEISYSKKFGLAAYCSCPLQMDCKHLAAFASVLIDLELSHNKDSLIHTPQPDLVIPPEWNYWNRDLAGSKQNQNPTARQLIQYNLQTEHGKILLDVILPGFRNNRPIKPLELCTEAQNLISPEDVALLSRIAIEHRKNKPTVILAQTDLIFDIIKTGRAVWGKKKKGVMALGNPLTAELAWAVDEKMVWSTCLKTDDPQAIILVLDEPIYVKLDEGIMGPVATRFTSSEIKAWLNAPRLSVDQLGKFCKSLGPTLQSRSMPVPEVPEMETIRVNPVAHLQLVNEKFYTYWDSEDSYRKKAILSFDYAGIKIGPGASGNELYHPQPMGKLQVIERNFKAENVFLGELAQLNFLCEKNSDKGRSFINTESGWIRFLSVEKEFISRGWQITRDENFRFEAAEIEEWYTDATPAENHWFDTEVGVVVGGVKVNLLPILAQLIQDKVDTTNGVIVKAEGDKFFRLPPERINGILQVLLELYDIKKGSDVRIRVPALRAAALSNLQEWNWLGRSELRELQERISSFQRIKKIPPPIGLQASLRPYQQQGLDWLQFLREYKLAGILADDMGLGKTVQALAHLLKSKEEGDVEKPSLVVAPTSLMFNWRQETARFAPGLKVLVLHGSDRKEHFEKLGDFDLILTTYPLLGRDENFLLKQEFDTVIFDEAQNIKNPKTNAAQVAALLKADHRLCLTGTPMENHLGELWSLFRVLLPGFLGEEKQFNKLFRRPIEAGDRERQKILNKRVSPFLLRRKKEEVALELPPKTEVIQNIELNQEQRDIYETVRLAMQKKVREEVEKKGLARSHIVILEALLKLRQICCHPRILKMEAARKVNTSSKFDHCLDMVTDLLEEGRSILLFSQFTSMLALFETALQNKNIPYSLLTGDTQDRQTPVSDFQGGKTKLFLISLKAGGTGLNLTAADTVIHYDPWWNPAAENQATDRAHRIGQDKPVFVYKLLTTGTVEEKIRDLQARKREMVEALFDDSKKDQLKITNEDLEVLFAPLS